jgi:carbamoyl-phosphate synthase small subunit
MTGAADVKTAVDHARRFPGLAGMDLARVVTAKESYQWNLGVNWPATSTLPSKRIAPILVVAYDFGIKRNILRLLVEQDCRVVVVPAQTSAEEVLAMSPDGVFLSNGPGDPQPCTYAIEAIRKICQPDSCLRGSATNSWRWQRGAYPEDEICHHRANHPCTI